MNTIDNFIAYLRSKVGNLYVWGAQGECLSCIIDPEDYIRKEETSERNANRAIALYRKRVAEGMNPIEAYDCSGLIVKFLLDNKLIKADVSSRGLYSMCTKIERKDLKPGDLVFRHNGVRIYHVGAYVGDSKVIESMGRDDGVVCRDINASGTGYWNRYGRLDLLWDEVPAKPYYAATTGNVWIRQGPSTSYAKLDMAEKGTKLIALPHVNGWSVVTAIIGGKVISGYSSAKYIKEV